MPDPTRKDKDRLGNPDLDRIQGSLPRILASAELLDESLLQVIRIRAGGPGSDVIARTAIPFDTLFARDNADESKAQNEILADAACRLVEKIELVTATDRERQFLYNFFREAVDRVTGAPGALPEKLLQRIFVNTATGLALEFDRGSAAILIDTASIIFKRDDDLAHGRTSFYLKQFERIAPLRIDDLMARLLPQVRQDPTSLLTLSYLDNAIDFSLREMMTRTKGLRETAELLWDVSSEEVELERLPDSIIERLANLESDALYALATSAAPIEHLDLWKQIIAEPWDGREEVAFQALLRCAPEEANKFVGRIIDEFDDEDPESAQEICLLLLRENTDLRYLAKSIRSLGYSRAEEFLAILGGAFSSESELEVTVPDLQKYWDLCGTVNSNDEDG